ncbi:hypothetical protein [Paraliobacillus sediminis]|nr:hypothetical protein [Paraliobacillus sediminis]
MVDSPAGTARAEDPLGKVFFFTNESFRLCPQKGSPFACVACLN